MLDGWTTTMWRACWQGGLVVVVVWSICRLIPSMPTRFQCWFWRLAVLKFVVALVVPSLLNVPLLPAHRPPEHVAAITALSPITRIHHEHLGQTSALPMPTPMRSLPAVLFVVWLIGVGGSLIRLASAWRDARRLLRGSRIIEDTSLADHLASQGFAFGLRRLPKLRALPGPGSPMLLGILRPVILMPTETLGRLDHSERIMVLGHEVAHRKRGDVPWSTAAALVRAAFFFHPLAWLNQRRLNLLQEIAADELAIARQQHDPVSYGKLLVSVVGKLGPARLLSPMSMGMARSVESLKGRLVAMTRFGRVSCHVVAVSSILLAATVVAGLVPWRLVAAKLQPGKPSVQRLPADKSRDEQARRQRAAVLALQHLVVQNGHAPLYVLGDAARPPEYGSHTPPIVKADGPSFGVQFDNPLMPSEVTLSGPLVTNVQLTLLMDLPGLKSLYLLDTQVTETGLDELRELPQLEYLVLQGPQASDAGLEHLKGLTQLHKLELVGTKVTDAGLKHLTGLTRLRELTLMNTGVSGEGLESLKGLGELKELYVAGAGVKNEDLQKLQRAMPRCRVFRLGG